MSSVSVPPDAAYAIGANLDFTVKFGSAVTVTGSPQLALTVGSNSRQAVYVSGSGTTDLTFRYAVAAGDAAAGGVVIGALTVNGGTIKNGGANADLTLNTVAPTAGILVDGVRPAVSSIALNGNPASDAETLEYTVTFAEAVTGIDASAFSVTKTGNLVVGVPVVSSASGATATVTVEIASGEGTVRLDVLSASSIVDSAGNALDTGYTSGVLHTVQHVPGAPAIDGVTTDAGQAVVSFSAPASDGGSTITLYTVTSNPDNHTATGSTSPITVAGLTNGTAYTFTVTATNGNGEGPASVASSPVTPNAGPTAPSISSGPSAATADGDGDATFSVIASDATGYQWEVDDGSGFVAISDGGVYSGATTATLSISAAPSGMNNYAYRVVVSGSVGPPATSSGVVLTVPAPAQPTLTGVTPTSGGISGGTSVTLTGTNFVPGQTLVTFGGLPGTGVSVDNSTTVQVTTPAHAAGAVSVVITTPGGSATAPAAFTYQVAQPVFDPAPGSLADAMEKEHYTQAFLVSGGSHYQTSDILPTGLNLADDGTLTGTLADTSHGGYDFTVTATTSDGPVSAQYHLTVKAFEVTVADKLITILPGATPPPVDLTKGATGGPFTAARIGTVTPPEAGTAELIMGDFASIDTEWSDKFYLKFHPNPAYHGNVLISYTLVGAGGVSSSAVVTFVASLDPNAVADNFDHLVKDFVRTRASLLANGVSTPGLRQRRSMSSGMSPGTVNVSPSDDTVTMNFASSLAELRSWGEAGDAAGALAEASPQDEPFNFWIDGTATLHLHTDDGDDHWGKFGLVSVGGDYLVSDKLLVGLAFHADFMDDLTESTKIEGQGILVGPYVSAEIVDGVFLDASVYYGHSWNEISTSIFGGSFQTDRLLAKASLEGEWALSEALTLRPKANMVYLRETAGQYTVTDGLGSALTIAGFTTDELRLSAGGTLEYTMALGEGLSITPYIGAQLGLSLSNTESAGAFTTLSTGFDLLGLGSWTLGGTIEADLESDSFRSVSAKANLRAGF